MPTRRILTVLVCIWIAVNPVVSQACSTLLLPISGRVVFARNYDFYFGDGQVVLNPRGLKKTAMMLGPPAQWVSKFGSVTFCQFGREFPCGGVNEAGLAIAVLWLHDAEYPQPDERPAVNEVQWVQYQLDTARTVKDVLASDGTIRIQPLSQTKLHYFVADRSGDCAVIEFLDGKFVAWTGNQLQCPVLANTKYADSLTSRETSGTAAERQQLRANPTDPFVPGGRFNRAAALVEAFDPQKDDPIEYAFGSLKLVSQRRFTRWQIVYDLDNSMVWFQTQASPERRSIDLKKLDFRPTASAKLLDIDIEAAGDVTGRFKSWTVEENRKLIETSLSRAGFLQVPDLVKNMAIYYPTSLLPAESEPEAPGSN